MPIEPALQAQIIIAAATVAGPNATDGEVKAHTHRIASYLSISSLPMAAFAELEKRDENAERKKPFPATVIGIDLETTSKRAVVFLRTRPSERNPNGQEFVRTRRTDDEAGRLEAAQLQSLIGHKIIAHVAIEKAGEVYVRMIRAWEDKGIDPEYNAADPSFQFDYSALDAKNAKLRSKLATQQPPAQQVPTQQQQQQGYPQPMGAPAQGYPQPVMPAQQQGYPQP
ncbi:MAG: hypothetical protein V4755_13890, partial [Curtobacterium sp.]